MKKILLASKVILGAGLIIIFLNSCKNETKQEDPKEVAEDANEAKFDSIDNVEDDSEFLVDQAEINLAEIEIGKLAQQKSTNAEVKKFGKMLVDEHTKSASEISALAKAKNFTLPTSLTEDCKKNTTLN
jgi:putative membrane protein